MDRRMPRVQIDAQVIRAVWEAEDGRCEACKRPMDKRFAAVVFIDKHAAPTVDNLQLVCVDCKGRRPDFLTQVVLAPEVEERLVARVGAEQAERVSRWLRANLKRHGVILSAGKHLRTYWLPGVGTFRVQRQEDGTAAVIAVEKMNPTPQVRLKPQARTRGFPTPDRRPRSAQGLTRDEQQPLATAR